MSLFASAASGSRIPPLEAGSYPAVCYGLIDLGEQYLERFDKSQHKVLILWEIPSETITTDEGEKPRVQSQEYTMSLSDRANLRNVLESWRGVQFTEEELKAFDMRDILGKPCMLSIINRAAANGNVYANISNVAKMPKGFPAPTGTLPLVCFDMDELDEPEAMATINELPDWIQKKVKNSNEFKAYEASKANEFQDVTTDDIPF